MLEHIHRVECRELREEYGRLYGEDYLPKRPDPNTTDSDSSQ